MVVMSKYHKLTEHLRSLEGEAWTAHFAEIERVLGFALPRSAYLYPAWWANQTAPGHSQNQGWLAGGWRTEALNLADQKVTFRATRRHAAPPVVAAASGPSTAGAMSIAQAKIALGKYYEMAPDGIEITIRG